MKRVALLPLLAVLLPLRADLPNAAEVALGVRRLGVVGSVLYVAAHPDDENTAFLAYMARERLVQTTYLSMTRGDGGQNLLGSEKAELLGLIRTQELLAARRIDGASQRFTRALDFGFTKSPDETFAFWGREAVLSDTVRTIRQLRPDVIVTRFPTTGEGGHGHHTASAILAEEAFQAAADPARFPELGPAWKPRRLLWNAFRFGANAPRNAPAGSLALDLGTYNPLLGRSYTEIAALSRSMHKSQGFGSAERRGSFVNDFVPRLGEPAKDDLFEGVDLTWRRVKGGEAVLRLVDELQRAFQPMRPSASLPLLVKVWSEIGKLDQSDPLVFAKRQEALELIRACSGLWLEAIAADYAVAPGGEVKVTVSALNRSDVPIVLESVAVTHGGEGPKGSPLKSNETVRGDVAVKLPAELPYSTPYWLEEPTGKGLYAVRQKELIGLPESPAPLAARFTLNVAGERLVYEAPVVYRWTDPVKGEQIRPFEVVPPVTLALDEKVYLLADANRRELRVRVRAGRAGAAGTVRLALPAGFLATPIMEGEPLRGSPRPPPAEAPFSLQAKGDEAVVRFSLTPPKAAQTAALRAVAVVDGREVSRGEVLIDYPHIPAQALFPPAEAKLVRLDLLTRGKELGYIMGSGDDVPDTLRQLGYRVTLLSDEDLANADLSRFDAIVAGVRAYNTRQRLRQARGRLLDYVEKGGTYVVQYATSGDVVIEEIGPYKLRLSRDRVTVEEAPVTFLLPQHPLLTAPNKLGAADFEGWVQERGLYFASEKAEEKWDPQYQTPIATHDPGESDKPGGLLYARYGKGVFVYTGYSFFRQLPAGVPGAIRFFVNIVSARGEGAARAATK